MTFQAGEQTLRELCARIRVSFVNAQNGFRDFIVDSGVPVTAGLAELETAIKAPRSQWICVPLNLYLGMHHCCADT